MTTFRKPSKLLYDVSSDNPLNIERSILKRSLKLAVTKTYFKSNDNRYCRKDGLEVGASPAVIFDNIWMKTMKILVMKMKRAGEKQKPLNKKCPICPEKVVWNSKALKYSIY